MFSIGGSRDIAILALLQKLSSITQSFSNDPAPFDQRPVKFNLIISHYIVSLHVMRTLPTNFSI